LAGRGALQLPLIHGLSATDISKIVRKEVEAAGDSQATYEKELHNLSMLRLIKHPNIVEMLAAYTFKGKHNLIFPKAGGKTLGTLLENPRSPPFRSLGSVMDALSGLCSALHAVHDFTFPNLSLIGCHHDLKPDNVLVHNDVFLLADFGLSTFKDSAKGSDTSFKQVRGDYIAPECEDFQNLSTRNVISRSSDVWSLGCIMLEVLTWMAFGPRGVEKFEESRALKIDNYTRHRFHHGVHSKSPAVIEQFGRLKSQSKDRSEGKLLILIRNMLEQDPRDRPPIFVVDAKMQYITIETLTKEVQAGFRRVLKESVSMQAWIGLQKLRGWMDVCNVDNHDPLEQWYSGRYPDYQSARTCLINMSDTLITILPDCQRPTTHLYEPLHRLNNVLYTALSPDLQSQAQAYFRVHTISTDNKTHLESMAKMTSFPTDQAQFMVLAKVRLLSDLTDNHSLASPDLMIDPLQIERDDKSANHGEIAGRHASGILRVGSNKYTRVIIENKEYAHGASERELAELVSRTSMITKLLREAGPGFRILSCSGFYHDPGRDSCGLVYEYPSMTTPPSQLKFTTLKAGLDQHYRKPLPRFELGNRFRLAKDLAVSLLKFHEAGWLQKNISSFNIGFFHLETEPWVRGMDKPYFLGYLNSRPNEPSAFTQYIEDPQERDYQHPDYLKGRGKVRYRSRFDYYSLGLVLLEIGRWESLQKMSATRGSPEEMREKLVNDKVPRVGQNVGSIYEDVVRLCLSDEFKPAEDRKNRTTDDAELHLRFSDRVVNQLARCTV